MNRMWTTVLQCRSRRMGSGKFERIRQGRVVRGKADFVPPRRLAEAVVSGPLPTPPDAPDSPLPPQSWKTRA